MGINFSNPLIMGFGMASVADALSYEQAMKEWEEIIKKDPRYPQWLKEIEKARIQREKEELEIKNKVADLLEKYVTGWQNEK